ncbi:MAG: PIN domain nuclease [Candidatus Margulisbacteria bacterium]|jgi:predicted nucleic acid-binding protein|nr:PIN domain nuclease [Candidatus Margulisiibacteriota bacterium]
MKKRKIYLDTTIISYLDQQDAPERMMETHKLWDKIKMGEFEVVISDVTTREINDCEKEKRETLLDYLKQIKPVLVSVDDKTIEIAERFVDFGILKQKSFDDCQHIASAIVSDSDMIVSWNFKHIVNPKTITGAKIVTTVEGYKDLLICTPTMLIEEDE